MKKLLFSLLFLFFTSFSFSQDYGITGTKWTFGGNDSGTNPFAGYQVVETEKDTIWLGEQVRKIRWIDYFQNFSPAWPGRFSYEYQSGDTIFQYNPQANKFVVKLIFDLNLGDTISIFPYYSHSSMKFKVDSISFIQVDSLTLKQTHLISISNFTQRTIIDRIGFKEYFNFDGGGNLGGPHYTNLRCYSDNLCDTNFNSYPCDFISYNSLNENFLNSKIQVIPNPVTDFLNINSDELEILSLQIFDIQGKEIIIQNISLTQLNVSSLKKGIYFLKANTKQGIVTKKWIKN
ncbi:MAG: T9SS type A sorting domain-containing protein [Flavobacteriales bacterium]